MKTVIENNKLIALFMGFKESAQGHNLWTKTGHNYFFIQNASYNTSWNRLMPVVETIEEIVKDGQENDTFREHRYSVDMNGICCEITDCVTNKTFDSDAGTKLLSTYHAIVDFIKWFNTKKEEGEQKIESMYNIFHNIDGEKTTTLNNDIEFIQFMKKIAIENEDEDFSINTLNEAMFYLNEYCENLTLLDIKTN